MCVWTASDLIGGRSASGVADPPRMRLRRRCEPARALELSAADVVEVEDVAHDLNNVLLAVRGYAELITWEAQSPEAVTGFAEAIADACERAHALTRQLLVLGSRCTFRRRRVEA